MKDKLLLNQKQYGWDILMGFQFLHSLLQVMTVLFSQKLGPTHLMNRITFTRIAYSIAKIIIDQIKIDSCKEVYKELSIDKGIQHQLLIGQTESYSNPFMQIKSKKTMTMALKNHLYFHM